MSDGDPRQTRSFRIRLLLARLVVSFERLWPAMWPSLAVVGSFVVLSLFGLWLSLPLWLHVPLLAMFFGLLGWTLWRARLKLRVVGRDAGLARLEQDSGVTHQPLRALDDTLPSDFVDPATRRLWALHRQRLIDSLERLRLAPPKSDLPRRDPWALRAALLLLLVVALVHGRGEVGQRLASGFSFAGRPAVASLPPAVDLWITPPAYTRRAPLVSEQTRGVAALAIPAGSEARVQAHHLADETNAAVVAGDRTVALQALGSGSGEAKLTVDSSAPLAVLDGGREIARWQIDVAPDGVPTVAFVGEPTATHRSVLKIDLEAHDDYGVAELALLLAPVGRESEVERLILLKPGSQPMELRTATYQDLTAHPLAGLPVMMRLEAVDAIDQRGQSAPLQMVLPAREFRHPLARAIIEERRNLAAAPEKSGEVAQRLAALGDTKAAQDLPTTVPLGLRVGAARLAMNEDDAASRRSVIDLLWELALFIEDGSLSLAERKLRDLQQELQKAMDEGATDKELEQLMAELQQAMDEFLDELTRQALQQGQQMQQQPSAQNQNGQTVERRDLQEMLDRAREMMQSGARDAARQMLAELQEMLENLRAGTQQAQPSQGEQTLSDLQKMIQMQQQLLERSFQMDREQRQGGQQEGEQGQQQQGQTQQGQGQNPSEQAAAEQEALRRALGELMRRMGEAGMEIPRALGQAEMQMRGARGALQEGSPGEAADAQA
ncbi:MAG: TIGR02302 family protein, partial [Geminicoccaceae bacterium]